MNCKNCIFYSGTKRHGHGENWGSCKLIEILIEYFTTINKKIMFTDPNYLFDNSKCIFIEKNIIHLIDLYK